MRNGPRVREGSGGGGEGCKMEDATEVGKERESVAASQAATKEIIVSATS